MSFTRTVRNMFLWYEGDDLRERKILWGRRLRAWREAFKKALCKIFGHSSFRYPTEDQKLRKAHYDPSTVLCNRCNLYVNAVEHLVHPPTFLCWLTGCSWKAHPDGYIAGGIVCTRCERHSS